MTHTGAQVLGLLIALVGGWLAFGLGGVLILAGVALVAGSLIVEATRPEPPTGGE
jgi:hypothetical protein